MSADWITGVGTLLITTSPSSGGREGQFQWLSEVSGVLSGLNSGLEFPSRVLAAIAFPSTVVAYLTGQRRIFHPEDASDNTLISEVREGFAARDGRPATRRAPPGAPRCGPKDEDTSDTPDKRVEPILSH